MRTARQLLALLQMSLGSFEGRAGPSLVTLVGTACVVGVLISMLSIGVGARREAQSSSSPDRALVETRVEGVGGPISTQDAGIVESEPGVRRDAQGRPMASGIAPVGITVHQKLNNARISVSVAGVEPEYFRVVPELKLTAGRMFRPGMHELIVGKTRYTESRGMAIGDQIWLRGDEWTIVGHFEAHGTTNAVLLTDAATLMSAAHSSGFWRIVLTIDQPRGYATLDAALKASPTLHVELKHESEAVLEDTKPITRLLNFVSYFVSAVMAAGATVGAVNALYALVDQRRREMATLRAIGFGGGPIVVAVLIESMLMALPGAVLGALFAWALFNGQRISPAGFSLNLTVTSGLAVLGIVWALIMGLLGGLLPALRAARVPVTEAMRAA